MPNHDSAVSNGSGYLELDWSKSSCKGSVAQTVLLPGSIIGGVEKDGWARWVAYQSFC